MKWVIFISENSFDQFSDDNAESDLALKTDVCWQRFQK
jgi:hypothetical protein